MDHSRADRSTLGHIGCLERRFLKPHRPVIAWAVLGIFAASLLLLPIPLLQGNIIDCLLSPAHSALDLWIGIGLAASIACYVARTGLMWKVTVAMSRVSLEVIREVTDAMHRKLQRLPLCYYDRQETGRIMARITSDVGSLLIFLNAASLQLFADLILGLGIVAVQFWLDWRLALICLASLPLFALNHRVFGNKIRLQCAKVRTQTAGIYALVSERVSAIRLVRSFAKEDAELREFDQRLDGHGDASWASLCATSLEGAVAFLIGGAGSVSVLLVGMLLIRDGRLSIGELLAFYALAAQLYGPITRLAHFHGIVSATAIAVERIGEVLEEPETITDRPMALTVADGASPVIFDNVTFSYPGRARPVLRNISLHIAPRTTVGILGSSGSGKSTLFALATRLYDIPDGQGNIRFAGTDIRDLRVAELRRSVLLVPQNAVLFDGTLRSNVIYARPDAPAADIQKALHVASLSGFVERLPLGLETPVGELGMNLSGGQRQRLALARALIANPAVLLLDDCTSAVDPATEAHILRELAACYPEQTRLVVSHKIAVVESADVIVVLEDGRITEQGTAAELGACSGFYARTRAVQNAIPCMSNFQT